MGELITVNEQSESDFCRIVSHYLHAGYKMNSSSCIQYGSPDYGFYERWMAILVKED